MFQPHVKSRTNKNIGQQLLAGGTIVHYFCAGRMKPSGAVNLAQTGEQIAKEDLFWHTPVLTLLVRIIFKRGTFAKATEGCTYFSSNTFNQLPDRSPTRKRVRINNNVGPHTFRSERHFFFRYDQPDRAFLTTPTAKFVAWSRNTFFAHPNFGKTGPFVTGAHKRLVAKARLTFFRQDRIVSVFVGVFHIIRHTNHHGIFIHGCIFFQEATRVQLRIVVRGFFLYRVQVLRIAKGARVVDWFSVRRIFVGGYLFLFLVRRVGGRSKNAAFNRAFVYQNRVLHIVPIVTHNGDNGIDTTDVFFFVDVLHIPTFHQRDLTGVQDTRRLVHALREISVVHGHRLTGLTTRK